MEPNRAFRRFSGADFSATDSERCAFLPIERVAWPKMPSMRHRNRIRGAFRAEVHRCDYRESIANYRRDRFLGLGFSSIPRALPRATASEMGDHPQKEGDSALFAHRGNSLGMGISAILTRLISENPLGEFLLACHKAIRWARMNASRSGEAVSARGFGIARKIDINI